jgi:uncharacterized protein (DUF1800 family)
MKPSQRHHAAIAAHRFGLGEADAQAVTSDDPRAWLVAQIGPADAQRNAAGDEPASAADGLRRQAELQEQRRRMRDAAAPMNMAAPSEQQREQQREQQQPAADPLRTLVQADLRARFDTAARTKRPFAERLALFWANHFTVSTAKFSSRGLVGPYEREAIRPHIAGRFEDLLRAAVMHPAMLRYLDNDQSSGPHSRLVQQRAQRARQEGSDAPRVTGLNENLAREVLELHTLGAAAARAGIYTQADVTAFAAVLTGWRVPAYAYADGMEPGSLRPPAAPESDQPPRGAAREANLGAPFMRRPRDAVAPMGEASPTRFEPAWHEPGAKAVLGERVAEGPEGLGEVLARLARHPATATFIATKLARHFAADDPAPALVDQLVQAWRRSDGDLGAVYRALIDAPQAWSTEPGKLKSPEEVVVSTARVLGVDHKAFDRAPDGGASLLGQRVQGAPSPAGWPDAATEWLGPDAVWKRVEWAARVADRVGTGVDARALAVSAFGPFSSEHTTRQIERAADGKQALALLLLSPEFQRR